MFCVDVGPHGNEQALVHGPCLADALRVAVVEHLVVDAVGRAAQRHLAQRNEVALAEEALDGSLGLLGEIHLALGHAIEQLFGREVDELYLVGAVEHGIGQRLPDAHAGHLAHDVVQALEVLHVERGVHADTGGEEFLHVLPAFRVARARGVRMRKLVDEQQRRPARERGIDVEFAQHGALVRDLARGKRFEAFEEGGGIATIVRFDDSHDDVGARGPLGTGVGEHRVGLADAGRGAEENAQLPARGGLLVALQAIEQRVRIRAGRVHGRGSGAGSTRAS